MIIVDTRMNKKTARSITTMTTECEAPTVARWRYWYGIDQCWNNCSKTARLSSVSVFDVKKN